VICGCNNLSNVSNQNSITEIQLLKEDMPILDENLIQIRDIVLLETNDSSSFGVCSLLKTTQEAFYILDESITKRIYKFDRNGAFIRHIGKQGRGPGEYINPSWFCVDENSGQVIVYDTRQRRLMFFNDKSGEFIKDVRINFDARSFEIMPDLSGYCFYTSFTPNSNLSSNNEDFQLIITDNEGQVIHTAFPFSSSYSVQNFISVKSVFSEYDEEVYFFSQYIDTIFKFNKKGQMIPSFVLDYNNDNQKLSDQYVKKIGPNQNGDFSYINSVRHSSDVFHLYLQFQTENHLYYTGVINKKTFAFLVDKKSHNVIDLTKYQNIPLKRIIFLAADEDFLYAFSSNTNSILEAPEDIKKLNINNSSALLDERYRDNPIIIVYGINRF